MNRKSRKQETIDTISAVLSQHKTPEDAIELNFLCSIARVSESEVWTIIRSLISKGMKIKLTDTLPRKFYCKNESC